MANYEYDKAVFIGRFQPFHNGHLEVLKYAQQLAPEVFVIIGSAFQAPTFKNPFASHERYCMIHPWVRDTDCIRHQSDELEGDWIADIQRLVNQREDESVCIVGYEKDSSSYYVRAFDWPFKELPVETNALLDATWIREHIYRHGVTEELRPYLPEPTYEFVRSRGDSLERVREEFFFVEAYKAAYHDSPYPPTHVTADAVVVCRGHVLLVTRGIDPGKGLLALPGGFVKGEEKLQTTALRELWEETQINVPDQVLQGSIRSQEVFDDPGRSLRGRTITHAFLIHLNNSHRLPRVAGNDDADEAQWVSFRDIQDRGNLLFEDHSLIIQTMLRKLQG